VLAAIWWAWTGYAWLTSTIDVDEGGVRLVMLTSMAMLLGVALAVPTTFGKEALRATPLARRSERFAESLRSS
jgi:low temperature requirement protein LtrA